jgi:small subunit ribosomal protein S18
MFSIQYATRPAPVGRPAKLGPDARTARQQDPFQKLRIDPRREAFNGTLLRNFISEMGKIKSRSVTGLSMQSQKRVAKAVRRAKMMGVMPVLRKATNNELYGSTVSPFALTLRRTGHR